MEKKLVIDYKTNTETCIDFFLKILEEINIPYDYSEVGETMEVTVRIPKKDMN